MHEDDLEGQEISSEVAQCMLAPSSIASELAPDLDPCQAADRYVTDGHEPVPTEVLQEAQVFLEYANASYYIEVNTSRGTLTSTLVHCINVVATTAGLSYCSCKGNELVLGQ